jgi:hypothetical protein
MSVIYLRPTSLKRKEMPCQSDMPICMAPSPQFKGPFVDWLLFILVPSPSYVMGSAHFPWSKMHSSFVGVIYLEWGIHQSLPSL